MVMFSKRQKRKYMNYFQSIPPPPFWCRHLDVCLEPRTVSNNLIPTITPCGIDPSCHIKLWLSETHLDMKLMDLIRELVKSPIHTVKWLSRKVVLIYTDADRAWCCLWGYMESSTEFYFKRKKWALQISQFLNGVHCFDLHSLIFSGKHVFFSCLFPLCISLL